VVLSEPFDHHSLRRQKTRKAPILYTVSQNQGVQGTYLWEKERGKERKEEEEEGEGDI
jgi:hypothetical protein